MRSHFKAEEIVFSPDAEHVYIEESSRDLVGYTAAIAMRAAALADQENFRHGKSKRDFPTGIHTLAVHETLLSEDCKRELQKVYCIAEHDPQADFLAWYGRGNDPPQWNERGRELEVKKHRPYVQDNYVSWFQEAVGRDPQSDDHELYALLWQRRNIAVVMDPLRRKLEPVRGSAENDDFPISRLINETDAESYWRFVLIGSSMNPGAIPLAAYIDQTHESSVLRAQAVFRCGPQVAEHWVDHIDLMLNLDFSSRGSKERVGAMLVPLLKTLPSRDFAVVRAKLRELARNRPEFFNPEQEEFIRA